MSVAFWQRRVVAKMIPELEPWRALSKAHRIELISSNVVEIDKAIVIEAPRGMEISTIMEAARAKGLAICGPIYQGRFSSALAVPQEAKDAGLAIWEWQADAEGLEVTDEQDRAVSTSSSSGCETSTREQGA
jgi:hypothetical protein